MLRAANIPFQTFDMNTKPSLPEADYSTLITPPRDFDLGKFDHVIEMFTCHAPRAAGRNHSILAFWEFGSGMESAFPDTVSGLPLVAMSDFNYEYFKKVVTHGTQVFKIRHPMPPNLMPSPSDVVRRKFAIPNDAFMVFFNFDYCSSYFRKNPEAILRAFALAFSPTDNAVLALKTSNSKSSPAASARLSRLAEELRLNSGRLITIDNAIPQNDMAGLLNACDVYVSLHRGEGFGIGMAQAMSLGKPVIATAYSANTEFCREGVSLPVPFKLVTPTPKELDMNVYSHVAEWAEPDIDFAAKAIRRCYDDPEFRHRIGKAAAEFIDSHFSVENFKRDVEAFLDS